MRYSRRVMHVLGLVVMTTALSIISVTALAQTKIAVVNIQEIMSESSAAQSIQNQLERHRKTFQEEFSSHERSLMEQEKKLVEDRASLSPEEFSAKREDFENKLLETRKLVQKRQRTLETGAGEALNEVRSEVIRIVADIADDQGYDLVVTRQNVILSQKDLDITDEVMSRLNKVLDKVELKVDTN